MASTSVPSAATLSNAHGRSRSPTTSTPIPGAPCPWPRRPGGESARPAGTQRAGARPGTALWRRLRRRSDPSLDSTCSTRVAAFGAGDPPTYGTATWMKSRLTGSLLRTAATLIVFAPDRSGAWIAQSWYQLSPGGRREGDQAAGAVDRDPHLSRLEARVRVVEDDKVRAASGLNVERGRARSRGVDDESLVRG
jgi:hypothetical protein